jgi:hypothetical protein
VGISGANTDAQNEALKVGNPVIYSTPAPASYVGTPITYLAADIIGGCIVHNTNNQATTANLPTAASIAALMRGVTPPQIGDTIKCLIINGGATGVINFVAGAGMSFDANQLLASQSIQTLSSKYLSFRFTGVTPGAETLTVYS